MPRLSILIPALGDCREFENTLASVLQNRPDDCEVLVAHVQPYGDPYKLAGEVCFLHVPHAKQVVTLLNAGFEAARSAIIHVMQCGLEVDEGWTEPALAAFDDDQVATVSPVLVEANNRRRIVSAGMGYTRWGRPFAASAGKSLGRHTLTTAIVGPTLQAGFYRRSWWRLLRWDETIGDRFAAAHYGLSLRRAGAIASLMPDSTLHWEDAQAAVEPFRFAEARQAEQLYWIHRDAAANLGAVALRTALYLAESIAALPSHRAMTGFLGRIAGALDRRRIDAARLNLAELEARLIAQGGSSNAPPTLSLDQERERRSRADKQRGRRAA